MDLTLIDCRSNELGVQREIPGCSTSWWWNGCSVEAGTDPLRVEHLPGDLHASLGRLRRGRFKRLGLIL